MSMTSKKAALIAECARETGEILKVARADKHLQAITAIFARNDPNYSEARSTFRYTYSQARLALANRPESERVAFVNQWLLARAGCL
jgi:hypothetical protein